MELGLRQKTEETKCGTVTTFHNWRFTLQTFSDNKSLIKVETSYPGVAPGDVAPRGARPKKRRYDPHAKIYHSALSPDLCERLEKANLAGAGVFFTVNETDFKGRETTNIRRERAVWADFDNGLPDKISFHYRQAHS